MNPRCDEFTAITAESANMLKTEGTACSMTASSGTCRCRCTRAVMPRAQRQQTATSMQTASLDDAYNAQMARQMNWSQPFEYHFDRGLYLHEVHPGLICGTQPRNPAELEELATKHRIDVVVNLQQDKDIAYWDIDFEANKRKCQELGIRLIRKPARDFDPHSLRRSMPSTVKAVNTALQEGKRVYVHCTAGLGRAPAVCIGWLYWFGPFLSLDAAYEHLTRLRPCGPKKEAVRGATYDVLDHRPFDEFMRLPDRTWAYMNEHDKQRLQQRLYQYWE